MSGTVLQYHLRNRTIPLGIIRDSLNLERTTINKWALGKLYPHRRNAVGLIQVFRSHGVEIDFNDIYEFRDVL